MFELNTPMANFASFLKNFTQVTFYGVTCNGKFFTLAPETSIPINPTPNVDGNIQNNMGPNYSGIFVLTAGRQINVPNMYLPECIDGRWYKSPTPNEPTYVEDLNCVLFISEKERYDCLEKYGDISKLVKSFAANSIPLINSSYIAVTSLNRDKQFYLVHDRTADALPIETTVSIEDYRKKYGITKEMLETNYVFIVNTIIRNSGISRNTKDTTVCTEIKRVEKSTVLRDQPIIFSNIGLVLFEDADSANNFLDQYGVLSNYLVQVALGATHSIHEAEIENLNERVTKDKRGMIETFGIMGGTSAISILTENLIKCSVDKDKEAAKKAGKAFLIGIGAIGSVVGIYKLYRYWEKKRNEKKNQ